MRYPSGKTHLFAIIGDPIAHVRATWFFNPIFEAKGLDAFLIPLHVRKADLDDVVPRLAKLGNLKGLIVTIPHKEAIARLCHELGPNAELIGAVNTVRIEPHGRLTGEMFDGLGLVAAMRTNGLEPEGRRILLVGAGGAGRAIAFALAAERAASVAIWNRTPERARSLAGEVAKAFPGVDARAAPADGSGFDIVVNCTSLGLHEGDPMPMDPATIGPATAFVDIIAVRDTELMQAARAKGCQVVGGRPMAELQIDAQIAFIGEPPRLAE
jgi:shikimate dehydrogenase